MGGEVKGAGGGGGEKGNEIALKHLLHTNTHFMVYMNF